MVKIYFTPPPPPLGQCQGGHSGSLLPDNLRLSCVLSQPVPTMSGHVDSAVLERMAKIMSYMRVSGGKPSKKPKKKDKLAALHAMAGAPGTNFPIVHGSQHIMPKPAGAHLLPLLSCSPDTKSRLAWIAWLQVFISRLLHENPHSYVCRPAAC